METKLDQQSRIPVNIVRQTSTRLTLRSLTWLPWFVGACFVAIGAFTGSQVGEKVSLDCSRESPGYCTFTSVGWFARQTKTFPVSALQQARLERLEADEDAFGYRVILILQDETLPFTQIATSGSKNHRRMTSINQFIQTPTQISLKVRADNRWIGIVIFSFLSGAGLLVILTNTVVTCDFDKAANQFTLCRWNLLGSTTYERPLHQFLGLRPEETMNRDGEYDYRLTAVLDNGEILNLSPIVTASIARQKKIAAKVQSFLSLPSLPPLEAAGTDSD